uniref:CCHC-type domain-containing protein n=1 Tax=Heterorhabditis bacteriophora TaxID=37862 RepID=A0A1I7XBF2_HETBA
MDNIPITMSWRTYDHLLLGTLLSKYTKIRPQTASLCRIVRKWAKVCGIDNSKEKQHGLVRYAFDLMVIHFLQTEDLLPVLHEMALIDPLDRPWDLADLFIRFLHYYTTQHSHMSERKKPSRRNSSSVKPNDTESLYSCDKSNGKRTTKLDEKTINAEDQNIDFTKLVNEEDIYTSESEDDDEKYGRLMSTKTFDGILLKNLQSYDVEIDDIQQYSRRTMYRLRRVNPIHISDEVFSNLERFNLNIRHVSLHNKELEVKKSKAHAIYGQKFCSKRKQKDTISIGSDEQSLTKENHKICFEEFFIEIPAYDDFILSKEIRNLINDDKFSYSLDVADNFTNGYTAEFKCSSCTSPKHETDNCPLMQIPEVDIISYEKSACEKQELDKVINSDYVFFPRSLVLFEVALEFLVQMSIYVFDLKKIVLLHISYYNVLALYNTEMLRMYCQWAPDRLPQLGMWVKKWAKYCNIGDASKGSLSSYTFILLVIHYLQNCEEPVLPRLQENNWSSNKKSVGELFIGFLDYYSRFDFKTQVVQIRRRKPLTKTEKSWKKPICIEDPFDRNHNLGAGVTKKMYVYIVKNFIKSRKVFMLPDVRKRYLSTIDANDSCSIPENSLSNYADELLKACSIGSPPLDRQCRICGKIGHFAESCPMKQRKRDVKLTARHGADSTCSVNSSKKSQVGAIINLLQTFYIF